MERDFSPNLLKELETADAQTIFILTGERGLGKHSTLRETEEVLRRTDGSQIVISVHPDAFDFSLWPVEEALLQACPDFSDAVLKTSDGLNYVDQLTRYMIRLCSGQKRVLIFLYHLHAFNDDLWAFTARLFRLLLDPYRRMNVCFCCCLHTNDGSGDNGSLSYRGADQIIAQFSKYPLNTKYLSFKPWPSEALHHLLRTDLFREKLCISKGQEELLLQAVMGNPATLVNLTERMKARGLIYEKGGQFICDNIDGSVLLTCGPVPVTEQYQRLDIPLRELLRGSSVIGVEFEAKLLSNPLEFLEVDKKLRELRHISRIIRQKTDDMYEFESMFARLSIRDFVSKEEHVLWNSRLGEYFWKLYRHQTSEGMVTASLNSLKKSAFYYDEAGNYPQAALLYDRLVFELMAIMQYSDAIKIIRRIRDLCEISPFLRAPNDLARTWQLEGDCYRYRSEFSKAIPAYETFLNRSHLSKFERFDAECSYYTVLYESGEIHRPLGFLRKLISRLDVEKEALAAPIMVRALSALTSIEETICDSQHEYHFNAALDIAKRNRLTDEYYVLLRKALIVHKGIYGMQLMESAHAYFEHTGNQKELSKVLCNIAAELLLHGDLEKARTYYQHSAELLDSFGGETIYVPLNGLGDYWCLRGEFEQARQLFERAYNEECDSFTRIAILINQATAYRKLGYYDDAARRLERAEQISNTGDSSEYAILLPHLLIGKALLLYDIGTPDEAYNLFLQYIREEPSFKRRTALAAQYIVKCCKRMNCPVPDGMEAKATATSQADERLMRYGITLIRFSITE